MRAKIGEVFEASLVLTKDEITTFATMVGDPNVTHHDEEGAKATRFKGIIASGAQITALMMGKAAGHFGAPGPSIAVNFDFTFRKPLYADEEATMRWTVTGSKHYSMLGGELIELRGELVTGTDDLIVRAKGKVLLPDA